MGRKSYDDDDSGEYRKPRAKSTSGNSIALWLILGVVGGILLLCGGATAIGLYIVYAGAKAVTEVASSMKKEEESKAKWSREEFKTMVVGLTEDEVIQKVGKPDRTSESAGIRYWSYHGITRDPVADKIDPLVVVWFKDGKVDRVIH